MAEKERTRGDTYLDEFVLVSKITKLPIDITTGYTFLLTLDPDKAPVDDTNNKYQLVGVVINGPEGIFGFAPTVGQANLLGTFWYDVQVIDPVGKVRTIEHDKYKYIQDITK